MKSKELEAKTSHAHSLILSNDFSALLPVQLSIVDRKLGFADRAACRSPIATHILRIGSRMLAKGASTHEQNKHFHLNCVQSIVKRR